MSEIIQASEQESYSLARLIRATLDETSLLSDQDLRILDRLEAADDLLKDPEFGSSNYKRAKALAQMFNISVRQAQKDIRRSMEYFNTVDHIEIKTYARILIAQLDDLYQKVSRREIIPDDISDSIVKILKLKKEIINDLLDQVEFDPSLIQSNVLLFNFSDTAHEKLNLEKVSRSQVLNFLEQLNLSKEEKSKIISDVEFTEVDDAGILSE